MVTKEQILSAIKELGLENGIICFHSSFKSFGGVEKGPKDIIGAFLEVGCTLVVPAFTYECEVSPPPEQAYRQNGLGEEQWPGNDNAEAYDRSSRFITRSMGVIPATMLHNDGRARGNHPLNSFAGLGPKAGELISHQAPLNVYGPYKRIYTEPHAFLVLAGVSLTRATPIHYAEEQAGRRLFRRWAKMGQGTVEAEVGSCSDAFDNFAPYVREIERNIIVGASLWRVFPFGLFMDRVARAILENPVITQCSNPECIRCRDMVKGGPVINE